MPSFHTNQKTRDPDPGKLRTLTTLLICIFLYECRKAWIYTQVDTKALGLMTAMMSLSHHLNRALPHKVCFRSFYVFPCGGENVGCCKEVRKPSCEQRNTASLCWSANIR